MSTPRKHHFVPQFLLRNFANAKGHLLVHRLDKTTPYPSTVRDVGQRNDGYTLFLPGRKPNRTVFERGMADLEGEASRVIRELESAKREMSQEAKDILAWFISLQWTRNQFLLNTVRRQVLAEHPVEKTDPMYEFVMKSMGITSGLVPLLSAWKLRNDPFSRPKERWNGVVEALYSFNWRICRFRSPSLVVSDNIVCLSGVRDGVDFDYPLVWAKHGVGIGFGTCQRVSVPLTPQLGLLLERGVDPKHAPARIFNTWTVYNSREFVAHARVFPDEAPRLYQSVVDALETQRFVRPMLGS